MQGVYDLTQKNMSAGSLTSEDAMSIKSLEGYDSASNHYSHFGQIMVTSPISIASNNISSVHDEIRKMHIDNLIEIEKQN